MKINQWEKAEGFLKEYNKNKASDYKKKKIAKKIKKLGDFERDCIVNMFIELSILDYPKSSLSEIKNSFKEKSMLIYIDVMENLRPYGGIEDTVEYINTFNKKLGEELQQYSGDIRISALNCLAYEATMHFVDEFGDIFRTFINDNNIGLNQYCLIPKKI